MSLTVVGLAGRSGTGKDWVAQHYFARGTVSQDDGVTAGGRSMGFHQVALADAVKDWAIARGLATFEEAYITKPPHIRAILQRLGTEEGWQTYGQTVWCEFLWSTMRRLEMRWGLTRFVITDVRFPHEPTFLRERGATVALVYAPDRAQGSALTPEQRAHLSETALDAYYPRWIPERWDEGGYRSARHDYSGCDAMFDAVIDNRMPPVTDLSYQLTMIARIHDLIGPQESLAPSLLGHAAPPLAEAPPLETSA